MAKKLFYKDMSFGYNEGLYNVYLEQISNMLSMTKVMKENLKSEKINAFTEAKEMLSSVKKYYSEKITYIKTKTNSQTKLKSGFKPDTIESMKFSSDEDDLIID